MNAKILLIYDTICLKLRKLYIRNKQIGLYWENYISISFHIEWDMIVMTVFPSILNQIEFHLVQNRKENCHHDHIPFNVKGIGSIFFSAYTGTPLSEAAIGGPIREGLLIAISNESHESCDIIGKTYQ